MKNCNDSSKNNLINIATGVLAGAIVGGALAMLFSPDSGKNNRKYLSKQAKKIADKMNETAHKAGDSMKDTYNKLSDSVKDTYNKVSRKA